MKRSRMILRPSGRRPVGTIGIGVMLLLAMGTAAGRATPTHPLQRTQRFPQQETTSMTTDWLLNSAGTKAKITVENNGNDITLSNGLIRRRFHLQPNAATVAFDNLMTGASLLRA